MLQAPTTPLLTTRHRPADPVTMVCRHISFWRRSDVHLKCTRRAYADAILAPTRSVLARFRLRALYALTASEPSAAASARVARHCAGSGVRPSVVSRRAARGKQRGLAGPAFPLFQTDRRSSASVDASSLDVACVRDPSGRSGSDALATDA